MARGDKGQATREALLEAALRLFAEQGYRATPMHQIAAAAGRSPGLTYRYFARKEDFGLALYQRIVDETAELVVDGATPGQRFASWMHGKLTVLQPHRAVLGALASAAVDPEDPLGVLSDETAALRRAVMAQLARVASPDGDADPLWVQGVYGIHMLLVLLFVQDRSDDLRATRAATDLVAQVLDLVPPGSPMAAVALARVGPVLELLAVRSPEGD